MFKHGISRKRSLSQSLLVSVTVSDNETREHWRPVPLLALDQCRQGSGLTVLTEVTGAVGTAARER